MPQEELDLFAQPAKPSETVLTVSELTLTIRDLLESQVGQVQVAGEISNYRRQASGHQYFTLKDERAQLSCVFFRGAAMRNRGASLADGKQVALSGIVTVYEQRGQYQLVVSRVEERGRGALHEKFEALKAKLEAEGLFAAERKQPLPTFPKSVALVTSASGAALRDMLDVLRRRAPWLQLYLYPVRVQGAVAAGEIAAALGNLTRWQSTGQLAVDVIIAGRGGGSIEDLWAFNEEVVARAVVACQVPVISAVGHETDFTICDFVADVRAPTPSVAAELATPDLEEQLAGIQRLQRTLQLRTMAHLEKYSLQLDSIRGSGLRREVERKLLELAQRVDDSEQRMLEAIRRKVGDYAQLQRFLAARVAQFRPHQVLLRKRGDLDGLAARLRLCCTHALTNGGKVLAEKAARLRLLGPQAVLERGYTVTLDAHGKLLSSAAAVASGSKLETRFHDGSVRSTAD